MGKVLFRYALTVALLGVVWHHAHWSVAIALTLCAVGFELLGWRK